MIFKFLTPSSQENVKLWKDRLIHLCMGLWFWVQTIVIGKSLHQKKILKFVLESLKTPNSGFGQRLLE